MSKLVGLDGGERWGVWKKRKVGKKKKKKEKEGGRSRRIFSEPVRLIRLIEKKKERLTEKEKKKKGVLVNKG